MIGSTLLRSNEEKEGATADPSAARQDDSSVIVQLFWAWSAGSALIDMEQAESSNGHVNARRGSKRQHKPKRTKAAPGGSGLCVE
jgi:hypothetical protein